MPASGAGGGEEIHGASLLKEYLVPQGAMVHNLETTALICKVVVENTIGLLKNR